MSKKKGTIYQVFQELPIVIEKGAATAADDNAAENIPTPAPKPPDDAELFQTAMKDVRKIPRQKKRIAQPRTEVRKLSVRKERDASMEDALNENNPINVANLPEYIEGRANDTSPLLIEKLRECQYSIQKVLDLHGLTVNEARDAFHTFIEEAILSGICCVKVIHGRGLKSRKGPVLKENLKSWIIRAMHRKWIVAFCSAKMSEGGPGATLILLRQQPKKKRLNIIG